MTDRREHDRRPPLEFSRDTPERFERSLFIPGLYDKPGKPSRLQVFWSDTASNGLVHLVDENVTSESATAQGLEPPHEYMELTEEQTRWLHRTLGELLPLLERR